MADMKFGVNIIPKDSTVSLGNGTNSWNIVSPNLTGTPIAPTADAGTNTTQVATTAFVKTATDVKVTGPSSAASNAVAIFDGTSGKAVKSSGYTIGKSVPSDAVFTDTTYSNATQSAAGLMSASDKTKLDGIATGATANVGTITGITMNGASKGTSGVVNLGTVITAHQDISGKLTTSEIKVKSGNNNWWQAPVDHPYYYRYEGQDATTYKLPDSFCVICVMKETNARGVAFAIRWTNGTPGQMWISHLHDDTQQSQFSEWKELGTITGITMNGASKGTTGVVDLGTVITSHQDISGKVTGPSSATNNAVAIFDGTGGKTIKNSGYTIGKSVPSDAVFTDTHRPIKVNGTQILASNTTALNLKAGSNVTLTNSSGTVTIAATDTTYSNATTSAAGLMSASDKTKLNGIESGANATHIIDALDVYNSTWALSAMQGAVLYDTIGESTAYLQKNNVASIAYSTGDFIIYNCLLCRANQNIAKNATISPDTNLSYVQIGGLNAINNDLKIKTTNWKYVETGKTKTFFYEGNGSTYGAPSNYCFVISSKYSDGRGFAIAKDWRVDHSGDVYVCNLHDDTSPYEWTAWRTIYTDTTLPTASDSVLGGIKTGFAAAQNDGFYPVRVYQGNAFTTIDLATSSMNGSMSKTDKAKLDGLGKTIKSVTYTLGAAKTINAQSAVTIGSFSDFGIPSGASFISGVINRYNDSNCDGLMVVASPWYSTWYVNVVNPISSNATLSAGRTITVYYAT